MHHGVYRGAAEHPAAGGGEFAVTDPGTGEVVGFVADGQPEDAVAAVEAAAAAFPAWAATAPRQRSEVLRRAFDLMTAETDELARIISLENGKPLADSRGEVAYAAEFFRWFSEEAVRSDGDFAEAPAGGTRAIVTTRPVGIAALVAPWNFPAAMFTRKIAPALAAGCPVLLKPASETPLTALALADLLTRAGAPAGVVNVVTTLKAGSVVGTWLADDRVRKVSFTGSTAVGRRLLAQAAENVVNASMELGGNAPFVVNRDADVEQAVIGAMQAKFRNGGQVCTAANRFYVHADVAEEFVRRFGARIEAQKVGHAFADDTTIGPMITSKAVASIAKLVDDAVAAGAKISHQAPVPRGSVGNYFPPTLLVDVPSDASILREEIFGPVAPVVTWTDEDELVRLVNGTEYGLASYVYSGDLKWAIKFAEKTEAGIVGVNRGLVSDPAFPFGGVKQSGLGREGARAGLREFQETQYFSVDWS
ncbi:aldehyde dehydrogenase family protein [Nocardioides sp. zg-579]|uniref:Aldehyde dehydrogenase family protein n=2 Tax=Nocardioides marmotae TaxID=2663857 RepID=A0A6I3J8X6_9ACTN|nr:NAD-dependent succinate-semialdehyde dehydrogenase [Nocardioides marmotae]MCR6030119.1 aldehyde dehydrogenase family protein [Gordonia jinghuaiqii]MTB93750.1 aldehyde dehydrogenase family protein [Nocardioides marmotae]